MCPFHHVHCHIFLQFCIVYWITRAQESLKEISWFDTVVWQAAYAKIYTCHKMFHCTAVADRLRTVGWSDIGLLTQEMKYSLEENRGKERDLTPFYDESPYTHRQIQKATWQQKNSTKNFDYTTIADRLRTVSWSSDSHQTVVVKPAYGIPTFPLTAKAVQSKGHTIENRRLRIDIKIQLNHPWQSTCTSLRSDRNFIVMPSIVQTDNKKHIAYSNVP